MPQKIVNILFLTLPFDVWVSEGLPEGMPYVITLFRFCQLRRILSCKKGITG